MLTEAGEDIIYICEKCKIAINKKLKQKTLFAQIVAQKDLKRERQLRWETYLSLEQNILCRLI